MIFTNLKNRFVSAAAFLVLDKTINPDLERMFAERAHSHKVEIEGASHAVYISHAKQVAALIEEAASQSRVADFH